MQRGLPKTLVLEELPARTTSLRAPGPGPITKQEWLRLGTKYFKHKSIIIHTDSAKAYLTSIQGTKHDFVVHAPKKLADGSWKKPSFVNNVRHLVQRGRRIWVRSGTQHIDGFWRILRRGIKATTKAINQVLRNKVRATQWRYTHTGEDLWLTIGIELGKIFI